MKLVVDTHCHTISSGHAYSTITEMAQAAREKGIEMLAMTDHGPGMPGGPHIYHLGNMKVIPEYIHGVRILRGVESNIMDYEGNLDLPEMIYPYLQVIIASFHDICITPGSIEENTKAVIGAMKNPHVDIVGHMGNPLYPIDIESVVQCAVDTGTLIEINNSSFIGSRKGSEENCLRIAKEAKKRGARLAIGSDSHISFDVGRFDKALTVLEKAGIPEELIMNTSTDKIVNYLNNKGRDIRL